MKHSIINKAVNRTVIYITATVLAIMIGNTVAAQGITTDENGMIVYHNPTHPENYLYLPSFKKWSFGLDFWNYTPWRIDDNTFTCGSPLGHIFITSYAFFDSSYSRPTEAISQKFMIDSTITIHGVALYREFEVDDSSLFLDWCRIEDSIQIQSLNHDTVYRSMSIAHLRVVDTTRGIYEYYFTEPLTISKPFTVVEKFSREHYRRIREYQRTPQMHATESLVPNNPEYEFHSNQRPSIKHYGDSNWYEFIDDPYVPHVHTYSADNYTDLYMLPIYKKAPEPICSLSVQAKPEGYGTVSGSGNYDMFSYVTIEAFPNENYRFVCWENIPNCDNPLTIRVMSDTTFVAIFDTLITNNIDMAEINEGITIHPNPATTILIIVMTLS